MSAQGKKKKLTKKDDGGPGKPTTADSLAVYNNALQVANYYNNNKKYTKGTKADIDTDYDIRRFDESNALAVEMLRGRMDSGTYPETNRAVEDRSFTMDQYRKDINSNQYYQREYSNGILDVNAPMSLYDKRITPQKLSMYANLTKGDRLQGDVVELATYDPIAVKPWNMLTPLEKQERVQKYGEPKGSAPQHIQQPRAGIGQTAQPAVGRQPIQAPPAISNVQAQQQVTPFSYSGMNRETGQQQSVYFPDLASWKNFVQQQGSAVMNSGTTNNDKQANATGYFKKGGLRKADYGDMMYDPGLAQVGQGPQQIYAPAPGQSPNINLMGNIPSSSNPKENPGDNNNNGTNINWNHVLASYAAQNMASALVSNFSPNSQQNATLRFNREHYSPLNYLPHTPNYSLQDRYGMGYMAGGGMIGGMGAWPPINTRMDDGGFISNGDMADSMRRWILNDDEDAPTPQPQQEEQAPQQAPQYNDDALQFATFVQLMGLDQADAEKEPEDQDEGWMYSGGGTVTDGELYEILGDEADDDNMEYLAKGGWIQKANSSIKRRGTKGVCTGSKFGGPTCRPGTRRYALAKTFRHMAKSRKHKHEDGGPIKEQVSTTSHTIPSPHLPFRNDGQLMQPSYEYIPNGATAADSAQYRRGFYNTLNREASGKLHPFDEKAYYWAQMNGSMSNARYPGVDVPGASDMFNSGVREAYINAPAGSFQFRKNGGNVGDEYDLSPETIIGLIGKGYQFDV